MATAAAAADNVSIPGLLTVATTLLRGEGRVNASPGLQLLYGPIIYHHHRHHSSHSTKQVPVTQDIAEDEHLPFS